MIAPLCIKTYRQCRGSDTDGMSYLRSSNISSRNHRGCDVDYLERYIHVNYAIFSFVRNLGELSMQYRK